MKQVLQYPKRGELKIEEIPSPTLKSGGVIIQNRASLLSAGTERSIIELAEKSIIGKAKERPDLVRQVIEKVKSEGLITTYNKVKSRLDSPVTLGYSCAGVVTEVSSDVSDIAPGQRMAAAGFGYASHAESVFVPKNLTARIPENVTMEEASFVTLGAIALQGVRRANPTLGETVAVIGLGLLGQLTTQMLRANGCRVIGMDIDTEKLELAQTLGCAFVVDNSSSSAKSEIMQITGGIGVDKVVITAASSQESIVNFAAEVCRERGVVTVVGATPMNLDRRPFYNKELSLNLSRSYGPGRYDTKYEEQGHDYPIGYVRWTERRNMECFLQMISDGSVNVRDLITHRFPIESAATGYDLILGRTEERYLGVVITYPELVETTTQRVIPNKHKRNITSSTMSLCAVGAGNFSTGVLYPALKNIPEVTLKRLVAPNGVKAASFAKQFGFEQAGTDLAEALTDKTITACLLATTHNVHAEQTVMALNAGKDVFVEKPLATTLEELTAVKLAWQTSPGKLMTGFNRRFSPALNAIKSELTKVSQPAMYHYRVNAGYIPKEHPLQDPEIGKGRIIGELCHFVDSIIYLTGEYPGTITATGLTFASGMYQTDDNVSVTLNFPNGSTATIHYIACGGSTLPKEYLEVHCGGVSFTVDDYRVAEMFTSSHVKRIYSGKQDKGHQQELRTFVTLPGDSDQMQKITADAFATTEVTLAVVKCLKTGDTIKL